MNHKYKVGQLVDVTYNEFERKGAEIAAVLPIGTQGTEGPVYIIYHKRCVDSKELGPQNVFVMHEGFLTPAKEPIYVGQDKYEVTVLDRDTVMVGCQTISRKEIAKILSEMNTHPQEGFKK